MNTYPSPVALTGEVVNDSGRGDGLPSARRTLDQTQRPLQHRLHSINLLDFFKKKGSSSFLLQRLKINYVGFYRQV